MSYKYVLRNLSLSQNTDKIFYCLKMKLFISTLFAIAAAEDKKVPPRHPLSRLAKLSTFAAEWVNDNLSAKEAVN